MKVYSPNNIVFSHAKKSCIKNVNNTLMRNKTASLPKTLGFMALLGLSTLTIPATANNRTNYQKTQLTEVSAQYKAEKNSMPTTRQMSDENNEVLSETQKEKQQFPWPLAVTLGGTFLFTMFMLFGEIFGGSSWHSETHNDRTSARNI